MKVCVLLLVAALATPAFSQENVKPGQDLNDYLAAHPVRYKIVGPVIIPIKEGRVDFYKYSSSTTDAGLKVLSINDQYVVGVLQQENGVPKILMDMDGDGKLDTYVPNLIVPFWVVADDTPQAQRSSTNNVKSFLDDFYQSFQSDDDPSTPNGSLQQTIVRLRTSLQQDDLPNRDLLYALHSYYEIAVISPYEALVAWQYLVNGYLARFSADHPLLYLHTVETLINLGQLEQARDILSTFLSMTPDSVPGRYYQWQLETDPARKASEYKSLKQDHPKHWMVVKM